MYRYNHVVLGGTFDHLHKGHEKLLEFATSFAPKISIGLTKNEMVQEKTFLASVQSFEERKNELQHWIEENARNSDVKIIPIRDLYGTTLDDMSLDAIAVTTDTLPGAKKINRRRQELGMQPLPIQVCDLAMDNSGQVISSTRVRSGEISRDGVVYASIFKEDLVLQESTRQHLRKAHGEQLPGLPNSIPFSTEQPFILVGDVITRKAVEDDIPFSISYIDGISRRSAYTFNVPDKHSIKKLGIKNLAGTISNQAARHVTGHMTLTNAIFHIEGEEDLLAAVAITTAPLGSHVAFGNEYGRDGISFVTIDEQVKQEFARALAPDSLPL